MIVNSTKLSELKVCYLAGTLEHGGAERQLFYAVRALREASAKVRVLSLDCGEFWQEKIESLGVPVAYVGTQPSRIQRLFRILKEVRNDRPALLQSQHFFANAYVGITGRILGVSAIGAMRNDGRSEKIASGHAGGWLNLRSPHMIAANSQVAIQYALDQGIPSSGLYLLPNVVDTTWFNPSTSRGDGRLTLLAVGRLVKQKRLDRFISMLDLLRRDFGLNVRGLIVGPGCQDEDLGPRLREQAKALGLGRDLLEFRGGVSDMRPVYEQSSVCVLTSDFEGTPNVLLEAMASGLPVVATRVGGVPEIVHHGETGFLVDRDDPNALAAALVELLKNSRLRREMGRRARAYIEENHCLRRLPEYLAELYERTLRGGSKC